MIHDRMQECIDRVRVEIVGIVTERQKRCLEKGYRDGTACSRRIGSKIQRRADLWQTRSSWHGRSGPRLRRISEASAVD